MQAEGISGIFLAEGQKVHLSKSGKVFSSFPSTKTSKKHGTEIMAEKSHNRKNTGIRASKHIQDAVAARRKPMLYEGSSLKYKQRLNIFITLILMR